MPKLRNSRLALLFAVALVGAFALIPASASLAQSDSPSDAQYEPPIPQSGSGSGSGNGSNANGLDTPIGSLPFTGEDLLILLAVAGLLVGTGYGLRKLSTPRGPEA